MREHTPNDSRKLVALQVGLILTMGILGYLAPGLLGLLIVPLVGIYLFVQKRTIPKPAVDSEPTNLWVTCGTFLFVLLGLYIALIGVCTAFEGSRWSSDQIAAAVIQFVVVATLMAALLIAYLRHQRRKMPIQKKSEPKPPSDLE